MFEATTTSVAPKKITRLFLLYNNYMKSQI